MSAQSNMSDITELAQINQNLRTIERDDPAIPAMSQGTEKSALVVRHNELVDVLWKPHTAHHLDPAKYLPIEIVNLIFSFVVYHVVEFEPAKDTLRLWESTIPPDNLIAHFRDGPLILTSVSRDWCQIVVNYPPLWSTILIDQSEDNCLERIRLFFDRSGKELVDIILLKDVELTIHLKNLLMENADRFKTLVGHSTEVVIPYISASQLTPFESPAGFVDWNEYPFIRHRISPVSIPKCLHRVQLYRWGFNPESLIQLTSFHNLESLVITIEPEPKDTHWDQKLQFGRLQRLHLRVSNGYWHEGPSLASPWIEWIECPLLVVLQLSYSLNREPSEETYSRLEASILRFRHLQKLQVHINIHYSNDQEADASRFQTMRPSTLTYNGNLEVVHVSFGSPDTAASAWAAAFTERFFTTFVPKTNLGWQYAQFPSPAMTANLKTIYIRGSIEGNQSALVAPEMAKLEFPLLEELYLLEGEPKWMNLLHAPRLIYLYIEGFVPSDLRHISNSIVSRVCHVPCQTPLTLDPTTTIASRLAPGPRLIIALVLSATTLAHRKLSALAPARAVFATRRIARPLVNASPPRDHHAVLGSHLAYLVAPAPPPHPSPSRSI